jgi:hypothetical protein
MFVCAVINLKSEGQHDPIHSMRAVFIPSNGCLEGRLCRLSDTYFEDFIRRPRRPRTTEITPFSNGERFLRIDSFFDLTKPTTTLSVSGRNHPEFGCCAFYPRNMNKPDFRID